MFGVFFKHAKSFLLPGSEQAVTANVSAAPSNSLRLTPVKSTGCGVYAPLAASQTDETNHCESRLPVNVVCGGLQVDGWQLRGGPKSLRVLACAREGSGLFSALARLGESKEEVAVDLLPAAL